MAKGKVVIVPFIVCSTPTSHLFAFHQQQRRVLAVRSDIQLLSFLSTSKDFLQHV